MISPYIVIYIFLLFVAFFSFIINKDFKYLYYICFATLTLMLCLRYGQGTDYFSYQALYNCAPSTLSFSGVYYTDAIHAEIGWKILNHIFKILGIEFKYFILVVSIFEMLCINRFIKLYCPNKNIALLMIYPTVYLTFCFSILRQGFVICVFLGIILDLILEKKYWAFVCLTILLSTIHSSALVILLGPFISKLKLSYLYRLLFVAIMFGILSLLGFFDPLLKVFGYIGSASAYLSTITVNYIALCERIIMTFVVIYMYLIYRKKEKNEKIEVLLRLYLFGTIIYLFFFWNSLISSRLGYIFKPLEISLMTTMILRLPKFKSIIVLIILALSTVLTLKNIDSYIEQGMYYQNVKIINYPYISIFNSEDIYKYRNLEGIIDI